jgi:rhamnosyltransferase
MKNIYAILVTFNPNLDELTANINLLKIQVGKVVLCNNSSFELNIKDESVVEFNFGKNLGIAKAQSIGMKWAFENGADFILQIDQDSTVCPNMVSELLRVFIDLKCQNIKVGLVGPIDYDRDTGQVNRARINKGVLSATNRVLLVKETLSSGSLISKEAYEAVGGMNDELFIDAVDFEYCWRLRDAGFLVARCCDAKLAHRLGDGNKLLFGIVSVGVPVPIRHYYAFRNTIYLMRMKQAPIYWKISSVIKLILKFSFYRFLFSDGKKRFQYMKMGINDGFKGKLGMIDKEY